jgi:hypothetical protein
VLSEASGSLCIELRIARAYMRLAFVSQRGDGAKAISLGRFGKYEVLLVELASATSDMQRSALLCWRPVRLWQGW